MNYKVAEGPRRLGRKLASHEKSLQGRCSTKRHETHHDPRAQCRAVFASFLKMEKRTLKRVNDAKNSKNSTCRFSDNAERLRLEDVWFWRRPQKKTSNVPISR
jgi:hypothetical protein